MSNQTQIVITSIFPPSEAIRRFSSISGHKLTVVGDRKTPADWESPGVKFLSTGVQRRLGFRLGRFLPWNHYCRKMLGYLSAIRDGAHAIVDTDDDNIPYRGWTFPRFDGIQATTKEDCGFINVYKHFSDAHIWPRGLPLELILADDAKSFGGRLCSKESRVGVWQSLADGDPDVDAVYRLTNNRTCRFLKRPPIVLAEGTVCPFNSQNTSFRREAFMLLYLPVSVTFRFTDILRSLVAQPILWADGFRLGFTEATVRQERNPHDYMKDFISEIPCYLGSRMAFDLALSAVKQRAATADNLHRVYASLLREGIVTDAEMTAVEAWIADVTRLMR